MGFLQQGPRTVPGSSIEKHQIGCLLRPSSRSRQLPAGAVHVATGTLQDLSALRAAMQGVDTVILGCTHYPLIRPILQRVFGRGVTLVFSAEETAREVAETLARKGIENAESRQGEYRFLTTGDPGTFRETGRRFLQLPIEVAERVDVATLEQRRAAARERAK